MIDKNDNIVIELTPIGRGAVAVVLAAGPDATRFVDASFRGASGRSIASAPINRILFGRWGGAAGEELVVCRRAVDRVEIHCHGGVAAAANVVNTLKGQGFRNVAWQDWLRHESTDPIRAAAQNALAVAPTARTAAILLDQCNGALSDAIRAARDAAAAREWLLATAAIDNILAHRDVGAHLTKPWRVVLAGAPNVGKSSLINAIAGYERAIVSPTPGTTRDVVTTRTAIDGWPVELADTAGLRPTNDPLESAGVALATAAVSGANLILLVHDASQAEPPKRIDLPRTLPIAPCICVWNKIDLVPSPLPIANATIRDADSNMITVHTSAVTRFGIATLIDAIATALVPSPPIGGAAVPFTESHIGALDFAQVAITQRKAGAACEALQTLLATCLAPALGAENGASSINRREQSG